MSSSNSILITGASGFIGSHIMEYFLGKGCNVYGVDRNGSSVSSSAYSNRLFIADLTHKPTIKKILRTIKPTCIIHHASNLVDVKVSILHPEKAIKDLSITVSLIETARSYGLKHVIFASSANVYGRSHTRPISEARPIQPLSPYGLTKLAIEQYLSYFSFRYGIPCAVLRYFNVYGPRQSVTNQPVIPSFIDALLHHRPLIINGGDQVRDFVYVTDVATANYHIFRIKAEGIYNVGSGKKTSIRDVLREVRKIIPGTSSIIYKKRSSSDCSYSVARIGKITTVSGWKPLISLEDGLTKTVEYFASHV